MKNASAEASFCVLKIFAVCDMIQGVLRMVVYDWPRLPMNCFAEMRQRVRVQV